MKRLLLIATTSAMLAIASTQAQGAQMAFVVDPAQSSLSITNSVTIFGSPLATSTPQGSGSFTTSYSGKLFADVTSSTIQLTSKSSLVAGNSGNWRPGSDHDLYTGVDDQYDGVVNGIFADGYVEVNEPANYGLVTDLGPVSAGVIGQKPLSNSAIRDIVFSLADSVAKPVTGGAFDEANTAFDFLSGIVYYSSGGRVPETPLTLGPAWIDIDPNASTPSSGTLTTSGARTTLTLPVNLRVSYPVNFLMITTTFTGTIVATVPEPGSFAMLLSSGAFGLVGLRRRARAVC